MCTDTTIDSVALECIMTPSFVLSAMTPCVLCACAGQEMNKAALGTEIPQNGRWVLNL